MTAVPVRTGFFISYSRRDATAYAAALAARLGTRFSCYLDQLATPRGAELPAPIRREVKPPDGASR